MGRVTAIIKRRGKLLCLPSHAEQKSGSGPNMIEGQAANGPYIPLTSSDQTDRTDLREEVTQAPKRKRGKKLAVTESSKKQTISQEEAVEEETSNEEDYEQRDSVIVRGH